MWHQKATLTSNLGVEEVWGAEVDAGAFEWEELLGAGVLRAQAVHQVLQRYQGLGICQVARYRQQLDTNIIHITFIDTDAM